MSFAIGTTFSRAEKKQGGQYIASKLLWIGLPWGIISTFLVTEKSGNSIQGLKIKIQYKILLLIWGVILALLGFGFGIALIVMDDIVIAYLLFLGAIGIFMIYKYIQLQRTTPQEMFVRKQLFKVMGYYVMPEWLLSKTFNDFYNVMKEHYMKCTNTDNWQDALKRLNIDEDAFAITFCLTYMDNIKGKNCLANTNLINRSLDRLNIKYK